MSLRLGVFLFHMMCIFETLVIRRVLEWDIFGRLRIDNGVKIVAK